VTKAGVLVSYWENEDSQSKKTHTSLFFRCWGVHIAKSSLVDDGLALSPVYSLAVHREALWLLSGLESGGINLQAVRHDEGKLIHCLRKHSSAVSVLNLAQDEKTVLSGSWDKTVIEWDLDSGGIKRTFEGNGSQISVLEMRPFSELPVPYASGDIAYSSNTLSGDNSDEPRTSGVPNDGFDDANRLGNGSIGKAITDDAASPADSLFGGNDGDSLFEDNDEGDAGAPSAGNFVNDDDDEFSRAIATGIREQEIEDANGDVRMGDTDDSTMALVTNGIADHKHVLPNDPNGNRETDPSSIATALPHAEELPRGFGDNASASSVPDVTSVTDSVFLAASIDGSIRVWDKRQSAAIAKITPRNVPPWCMTACWSPDGNFIYAGRRNGTVEEFSLHKGLRGAERSFKLPNGSGPVSAIRAMPNGRHLVWSVSFLILNLTCPN
jgi:transcriptional activator SPT8